MREITKLFKKLEKIDKRVTLRNIGGYRTKMKEVTLGEALMEVRYILGDIAIELGFDDIDRNKLEKEIFGGV